MRGLPSGVVAPSSMFGFAAPKKSAFASEKAMLVSMGFEASAAQRAIEGAGGDVERAVAALTAAPPAASPPASAGSPPPSASSSLESDCAEYATRLARCSDVHAGAVAAFLRELAAEPSDARLKVVLLGGRGALQDALREAGGAGVELLLAAGYRRHDAQTLALRRFDAARVYAARSALEAAAQGDAGRAARAARSAREGSDATRALCRSSFASIVEPAFGGAGVSTITFSDAAGLKFATRRFDGDDCLERVLRFLATCDVGPPDDFDDARGGGWRVAAETTPPSFWCDAWRLRDGQGGVEHPALFGPEQATKTLTSLKLWPSATLVVEAWDAQIARPTPRRGAASLADDDLRGGRRLGAKPKPSELFRRTEDRFAAAKPLAGAGDRKQHYNIAKSADKVPGLPRLLAMGFPEPRARAALKRHQGNVEAAANDLLSGA